MGPFVSSGPWDNEPDEVTFVFKCFKCVIKRMSWSGVLNGYVHVPKGNLYYGKSYDVIPIICHGGLTYSSDEDGSWVIGFDTAHYLDYTPKISHPASGDKKDYKDINYVKNECMSIVWQLLKAQDTLEGLILVADT
jgi:hypothetical protein